MTLPTRPTACKKCGFINRAGVIFCEKCGNPLGDGASLATTHGLSKEILDKIETLSNEHLSDTVKVDDIQGIATSNTSLFDNHMCLRLEIEEIAQALEIQPREGTEYIIGRHDPEVGFMPEIDLLPYGGYRMGISRRHAAILLLGKRLTIRDLGSSNGTALNGTRIDKYEAHQLRDGDRLRMGNLTFRIRFI